MEEKATNQNIKINLKEVILIARTKCVQIPPKTAINIKELHEKIDAVFGIFKEAVRTCAEKNHVTLSETDIESFAYTAFILNLN